MKMNLLLLMIALTAGVSFVAIPSNLTFAQTKQVSTSTSPNALTGRKAMLGVSVTVPATEEGLGVEFVVPESPAATAGIQVGDVLLQFDDQLLFHPLQLQKLIERSGKDREVKITYVRGTDLVTGTCRLVAAPIKSVDLSSTVGVSDEVIKKALKDAGIPEVNMSGIAFVRIGDPGNAVLMLYRIDDGWTLSIRDLTGKEVFSGPFNNDTDRAGVPEKYQPILPYLGEMTK